MHYRNQFVTVSALISMLFLACANAAVVVKAVISPGDVAPIKRPFDEVAFEDYVAVCKSELEFDDIPQMDCNDIHFAGPLKNDPATGEVNDFVTHAKVTNVVDAVFACRGLHPNEGRTIPGFINEGDIVAASGEMIVHNKVSGKTCFFKARPTNVDSAHLIDGAVASTLERISNTNPPSPTDLAAFKFWGNLDSVAQERCTQCHSAGPWIASTRIVDALTQFGLINDGHDIQNQRYTAVGALAKTFNQDKQDSLTVGATQSNNCSASCHVLAGSGVAADIVDRDGHIIIPSITKAIMDIHLSNLMPANNHSTNPYRWMNLDNPGGAGGDWERLKDLKAKLPQFVCKNGVSEVQAHVVDSVRRLSTNDFPDVLSTFNLLDGLVCNNADQSDGHTCSDYQTRYHCSSGWTKWRDLSAVTSAGDDESRANFPGLCSQPTEIQARIVRGGVVRYSGFGPPDRLQEFDLNGVACRNSSQPSGQCNDYTVRFICTE